MRKQSRNHVILQSRVSPNCGWMSVQYLCSFYILSKRIVLLIVCHLKGNSVDFPQGWYHHNVVMMCKWTVSNSSTCLPGPEPSTHLLVKGPHISHLEAFNTTQALCHKAGFVVSCNFRVFSFTKLVHFLVGCIATTSYAAQRTCSGAVIKTCKWATYWPINYLFIEALGAWWVHACLLKVPPVIFVEMIQTMSLCF